MLKLNMLFYILRVKKKPNKKNPNQTTTESEVFFSGRFKHVTWQFTPSINLQSSFQVNSKPSKLFTTKKHRYTLFYLILLILYSCTFRSINSYEIQVLHNKDRPYLFLEIIWIYNIRINCVMHVKYSLNIITISRIRKQ